MKTMTAEERSELRRLLALARDILGGGEAVHVDKDGRLFGYTEVMYVGEHTTYTEGEKTKTGYSN